jgi:soluble cytochrome b562
MQRAPRARLTPMRTWIPVTLLLIGGCAAKKNTPIEEIPKLQKLSDVMDNQSTTADPLFKKMGQGSYSDAEFSQMADAAARLAATSAKIKDFSKGAGFDALALQLTEKARALGEAAQAKNAANAATALREMKATCRECHQKFR